MSAIRRSPSARSVSSDASVLFTVLRCSLAQRVNVFCWIRFQTASSASSRSITFSSSSPATALLPRRSADDAILPLVTSAAALAMLSLPLLIAVDLAG
uniref:Uncharacterized protein n=1 Tax=Ixodes ricinus TaxID=34613 RepID=A0A6B0UDY9_IXORI